MRVLITGGAGFIGSHLARLLLREGNAVSILDDLSTGRLENLERLGPDESHLPRLEINVGSVLNTTLLARLVKSADLIFHLAAAVGVKYVMDNPVAALKTNIHGTEAVLEQCSSFDKTVLLASTSEVYGKHDHSPLKETDVSVFGPSNKYRWSYAASKYVNECTALSYRNISGLKVIIVRLFNTIGPVQTGTYGMVVPRFVKQALSGNPLTVYGSGTQTRTFAFVDDVAAALSHLMRSQDAVGEIVNVGGNTEVSISELAKKVIALTGSDSVIESVPYEDVYGDGFEDMQRRLPSNDKLASLIGWMPETTLDTMLEKIISHARTQ